MEDYINTIMLYEIL